MSRVAVSRTRSAEFLGSVVEEITMVHGDLLALMREVELVEERQGESAGAITLAPEPAQQRAAAALLQRYRVWYDRVRPFLDRSSTAPLAEFDEAFVLFGSYLTLRRVGSGVTLAIWRELFELESGQVVRHQLDLLEQARECFTLLDRRPRKHSETLTLRFVPVEGQCYRVSAESRLGDAEGEMTVPFDDRDLENFILRNCDPTRGPVRGWTPPSLRPYADFGGRLFGALFIGPVRDLYMKHVAEMASADSGLRILFRTGAAPWLASLPWEYLYDGHDFLALTGAVTIARHVDADRPVLPLAVEGPLRIAVTVSAPTDQVALDVAKEVESLKAALAPLVAAGLVRVDVAPDGTIATLASMLRAADVAGNPFHVWHFVGHGRYLAYEGATHLMFEDANGTSVMHSGFQLGTLLSSHPALRLAVLNACEGARAAPEDSLTSVAAALVARRLPAVVAMQFSITDTAAIRFADDFYRALAADGSLDTAIADARRAVFFMPNESEWATPVIMSRAEDGVLFEM
jgi:hypothetical protein